LQTDNQTLIAQREVWEAENADVQTQMQRLSQSRVEVEKTRDQLERKHNAALSRVEAMEKSLHAEQEAHRKTQQQAQQEFNKIVEAQADAEQQLRELQASNEAALSRAEDGESVAKKFEDKNHELALAVQHAQDQVQRLERERQEESLSWGEQLKSKESLAEQHKAELQRQTQEIEHLREVAENRTLLEGDHEALARTHAELQQDYDQIQTKLESELDSHAETREKTEELQEQLRGSAEQLAESDEQVQQLNQMLVGLRETVEDRTQRNLELETNQTALREQAAEAEQVLQEKQELAESLQQTKRLVEERQAQFEQIGSERDQLTATLEEANRKTDEAIAERDQAQSTLTAVNESIGELRSLLAERDLELTKYAEERSEALQERDATIGELQSTTEQLKADLESKDAAIREQQLQMDVWQERETEYANTKRMLGERTESLQARTSEYVALSARMDQQKQQVMRLQSESTERTEQVRRLERELEGALQFRTQAEDLGGQCQDLQRELADANRKVHLITKEHEASLDANAAMEERVVSLETQLHSHNQTIRELRRHRVSMETDSRSPSSDSSDGTTSAKRAA